MNDCSKWRTTASSTWFDPDTEAILLAWVKPAKTAVFVGQRNQALEQMVCLVGVDVEPCQLSE